MPMTAAVNLADFNYILPDDRIARTPLADRAASKLLVCERGSGLFKHAIFRDLEVLLRSGDVLVLNNTKVLPARLYGKKATGGQVEALLLEDCGGGAWEVLLKPSGRIQRGTKIHFTEGKGTARRAPTLVAEVMDELRPGTGERKVRFEVGAGPCACPSTEGAHGGAPLRSFHPMFPLTPRCLFPDPGA